MIAGNQRGARVPRDLYPTPAPWTYALLDRVFVPHNVWEPAAGGGDMVRALESRGHAVVATDIETGDDFLTALPPLGVEAVVTNPPFSMVDEFIERATQATDFTALLLGWHYFSGGVKRVRNVWQINPPSLVLVVADRMKFPFGTSQFSHAWAVWDGYNTNTRLEWCTLSSVGGH